MDIIHRSKQAPAVPFALMVLVALALLVGAAGVSLRPSPAVRAPSTVAEVRTTSPDAQERNAKILADRLGKAEATHGH